MSLPLWLALALAATLFPLGLSCKGDETPPPPPDPRLNGLWFSQDMPGATLDIDLDERQATWREQLVGTFNPFASPDRLDLLDTTYVGITSGLNDDARLAPVEQYADDDYLNAIYPAATLDVLASDRIIWRQHLSASHRLGLRYTSAFPTFFPLPLPFVLTQQDQGTVHGNAEMLHFEGDLGRYHLSYELDLTGTQPRLNVLGITFVGNPGATDMASGSPWHFDERTSSGILARLLVHDERTLEFAFELFLPLGDFIPPVGPLWGMSVQYRFSDDAQNEELVLVEYEPFQHYHISELDDGTFTLRLAMWSLAEGHSAWTVPTTLFGQTALVFVESPNLLGGLGSFDGLPVFTPLGTVDGVVGAWVNPDTGVVVTFADDGRWATSNGNQGHWRQDGERVYYAEEQVYQR